MKKLIYLFLILCAFSCKENSNKSVETVKETSTKNESETKNQTQVIEKEFQTNLDEYVSLIDSLNVYDIESIQVLKEYVLNELKVPNELADSAYYLFLEFFYTSANNLTDSLETKYSNLIEKLYRQDEDSEVREFYRLLNSCGLDLFMTEGMFYVDVQSDFFYNTFKNNLSPSLKTYLQLRNSELKNAFSEDAMLLIPFDNLAERVYYWEKYLTDYPETKLINEANYYYKTYLQTLLTGLANTSLFDWESKILLQPVKEIYESYLKKYPETKSGMIVREYYDILERNKFEHSDSIDFILNKYNLISMHNIQPHTR